LTSVLALLAGLYAAQAAGPNGFYDMCAVSAAECRPVAATRSLELAEVDRINRAVNGEIRPRVEPEGQDVWLLGPSEGDCDDYVMTKRHRLIAAGLGSAEARVAVGVAKGQLHAVLVVHLGPEFYVLDNLTDEMLPVERSDVRILTVQSAANPLDWQRAPGSAGGAGQAVAAGRQ